MTKPASLCAGRWKKGNSTSRLPKTRTTVYRLMVEAWFDLVVVNLDSAVTGADLIKRIRANPDLGQLRVLTIAAWGTARQRWP